MFPLSNYVALIIYLPGRSTKSKASKTKLNLFEQLFKVDYLLLKAMTIPRHTKINA